MVRTKYGDVLVIGPRYSDKVAIRKETFAILVEDMWDRYREDYYWCGDLVNVNDPVIEGANYSIVPHLRDSWTIIRYSGGRWVKDVVISDYELQRTYKEITS